MRLGRLTTLALLLTACGDDLPTQPTVEARFLGPRLTRLYWDAPPQLHRCDGDYWLFIARDGGGWSKVWAEIETDDDGALHGWAWDAAALTELTGTCEAVLSGQSGWIEFERRGSSSQFYMGEFTVHARQITLEGSWNRAGAAEKPFYGFTLLDDSAIRLEDAEDVERMRARIIELVWGDGGFPLDAQPAEQDLDVESPLANMGPELDVVNRLRVEMDHGFESYVYHFLPSDPANRLMIVHQGHSSWLGDVGLDYAIRRLLARGFDVLGFFMPAHGPNDNPLGDMLDHSFVFTFHDDDYDVLRFFLEPVAVALNFVGDRFAFVGMMGVSGGGWTTTLYAAIDPRIQMSFPVAGSLPLAMRFDLPDIGDWEQFHYPFYRVAGYPELYVLGSVGEGRQQVQILNEFDPCCFSTSVVPDYVEDVSAAVEAVGLGGSYRLHIDPGHNVHAISQAAFESVIAPAIGGHDQP